MMKYLFALGLLTFSADAVRLPSNQLEQQKAAQIVKDQAIDELA